MIYQAPANALPPPSAQASPVTPLRVRRVRRWLRFLRFASVRHEDVLLRTSSRDFCNGEAPHGGAAGGRLLRYRSACTKVCGMWPRRRCSTSRSSAWMPVRTVRLAIRWNDRTASSNSSWLGQVQWRPTEHETFLVVAEQVHFYYQPRPPSISRTCSLS